MNLICETSDSFGPQIATLGQNIGIIDGAESSVDCTNLNQWVSPLSLLPLAAAIYEKNLQTSNVGDYLKRLAFPTGIDDPDFIPRRKTYLPIIRFRTNHPAHFEEMTTRFTDLVLENLKFGRLIVNPFKYAVGEMVANICEHSLSPYGWMLAQYYKSKEFLDVVFLDRGRGLKMAYEKSFEKSFTDEEAIQAALRGVSIKKTDERGFGLWTTKKMIMQSPLHGKFLIISGGKGYFSESGRELIFDLESWHCQGTMVILRMNKVEKQFDYTPYVE